jgi:hypothetical protein
MSGDLLDLWKQYGGGPFSYPAFSREAPIMNILLIEAILDRYVAKAERRQAQWSAKDVEMLLRQLREEVLACLK